VITHREASVHVSGHPAQDELAEMYRLIRPRIAVPVHGELRHLRRHAAIARDCGVDEVVIVENGGLVRIAPGPAGVVETVPSGRLALEGNRLVRIDGNLVRERTKAIYRGVVFVTVAVNNRGGLLKDPLLSTVGLVEEGEEMVSTRVGAAIADAIGNIPSNARGDDDVLREAVRSAIRRSFRELFEKKPLTYVHVVRC
jgi:ribonuclease J